MANVIIRNKLNQVVPTTVLVAGKMTELKLAPNASSAPMDESTITPHVRRLAERGFVKISPAP